MKKYQNMEINEVWPTSNPNGGIGIDWSGSPGFGQLVIYWGRDGKLHADTECMSRDFVSTVLPLLANLIVIDGEINNE